MQSRWFLSYAGTFLLAGWLGASQSGAANAPYMSQASEKQTWTQKLTSPFKSDKKRQAPPVSRQAHVVQQTPMTQGSQEPPSSAAVYLSMAEVGDRTGNTQSAREMYQRALSYEPGNRDALLGIARLEDRAGNFQAAIYHYQQAASRYPHDAKIHNDLALCLARSGQTEACLQMLDQAVRQQPNKHLYRNNVAKVLVELNRDGDALRHLSAVYPPAIAQYNLGALLVEKGRTADAIGHLHTALKFDPQLHEAQALLAEITHPAGPSASETLGSYQPQPTSHAGRVSNDHILPTPKGPSPQTNWNYPSTSTPAALPTSQLIPGETAQVPINHSPVLLPPVR